MENINSKILAEIEIILSQLETKIYQTLEEKKFLEEKFLEKEELEDAFLVYKEKTLAELKLMKQLIVEKAMKENEAPFISTTQTSSLPPLAIQMKNDENHEDFI